MWKNACQHFQEDILLLFSSKSTVCILLLNQSAQTFSCLQLFWGTTDGKSHGCFPCHQFASTENEEWQPQGWKSNISKTIVHIISNCLHVGISNLFLWPYLCPSCYLLSCLFFSLGFSVYTSGLFNPLSSLALALFSFCTYYPAKLSLRLSFCWL